MKSVFLLALLQVSGVFVSIQCLPAGLSQTAKASQAAQTGLEATLSWSPKGLRGRPGVAVTGTSAGAALKAPQVAPAKKRPRKGSAAALLEDIKSINAHGLYDRAPKYPLPSGGEAIHVDDHHAIVKHAVHGTMIRMQQHYKGKIAMHKAVAQKLKQINEETIKRQHQSQVSHSGATLAAAHKAKDLHHGFEVDHFIPEPQTQPHQGFASQNVHMHDDTSGHHLAMNHHDPLFDGTSLMSLLNQSPQHHAPHSPASHALSSLTGEHAAAMTEHHPTGHHEHSDLTHQATEGQMSHGHLNLDSPLGHQRGFHAALYDADADHEVHYNDPHLRAFHKYDPMHHTFQHPGNVGDSINLDHWTEAGDNPDLRSPTKVSNHLQGHPFLHHNYDLHGLQHLDYPHDAQVGNGLSPHDFNQHLYHQGHYDQSLGIHDMHGTAHQHYSWDHDSSNSLNAPASTYDLDGHSLYGGHH